MKTAWLQHAILRVASLLAPGNRRAEWVGEWQSELWYVPRRGATRFCLGAFQDAFWVRRNNPRQAIHLESSLHCLAFLAALAAASLLIAVWLPAPPTMTPYARLRAQDLPIACMAMTILSGLILPALRIDDRAGASSSSGDWLGCQIAPGALPDVEDRARASLDA
jgi:hypothetical protein